MSRREHRQDEEDKDLRKIPKDDKFGKHRKAIYDMIDDDDDEYFTQDYSLHYDEDSEQY